MYSRLLYALALLWLISCGPTREVVGNGQASANLPTREIIRSHDRVSPTFKTLAGRIKVAYREKDKSQSMTVSLRMEKDQKIWIKASILGITLAKVYMTTDSVQYYETLSNSYFEGDFSLISEWLGTEVDFKKTQAILLGQAIFDLDKGRFLSTVQENQYHLAPKKQFEDLIYSLALRPDNFKVASTRVTQPAENREFLLEYGPYQKLEAGFFPSEVSIDTYDGYASTRIEVTYRKIDLDVPLSFPFAIPRGYQPINLGQ